MVDQHFLKVSAVLVEEQVLDAVAEVETESVKGILDQPWVVDREHICKIEVE